MSDIFDHEGDAWNSLMFNEEDGACLHQFRQDLNYYYIEISGLEFEKETAKRSANPICGLPLSPKRARKS